MRRSRWSSSGDDEEFFVAGIFLLRGDGLEMGVRNRKRATHLTVAGDGGCQGDEVVRGTAVREDDETNVARRFEQFIQRWRRAGCSTSPRK